MRTTRSLRDSSSPSIPGLAALCALLLGLALSSCGGGGGDQADTSQQGVQTEWDEIRWDVDAWS